MRLKYALKNSIFSVFSQIFIVIFGIVLQRVMVNTLTKEIIGINSVFANIISILSLSEMGISAAIVYNLYMPIAQNDKETICKLMSLFKTAYRVIAVFVAVLGIAITPFVHIFVSDSGCEKSFLYTVFLLFVAKTALSYLFSYKRSLITANQKVYILTGIDLLTRTVTMTLNIIVLLATQSIVWYLVVSLVTTVTENIVVSFICDKMYPFAKSNKKIDRHMSKKVFSDVGNIFVGKLSATVLNSTDYIIISSFTGVVSSALYYNYNLIINSVLMVIQRILTGIQSSIGDMFTEGNNQKNFDILRQLSFIFFWLSAVCGTLILCLIDPFVCNIWLSYEWKMPINIVALCVLIFFMLNVRGPLWSMISVSGLFSSDKYISLVGTISNLVVSIVLVMALSNDTEYMWGVFGVFVGTLTSQTIQFLLKTRLLFNKYLFMSRKKYATDIVLYFIMFAVMCVASYFICINLPDMNKWLSIVIKAVIAFSISNVFILVAYFRTKRFKSVVSLLRYYIGGAKKAKS